MEHGRPFSLLAADQPPSDHGLLAFLVTSVGLLPTRARRYILPAHVGVVLLLVLAHPLTRHLGRDGSLVLFLVYGVSVSSLAASAGPRFVLLAASMAMSLLVLEAGLSLLPDHQTRAPGVLDYGDLVGPYHDGGFLKPNLDVRIVGEHGPVRFVTNNRGFRNGAEVVIPKPPGVYRILLVGDSFVVGYRIGQNETIGATLEADLRRRLGTNVEVLVAGAGHPAAYLEFVRQHANRYDPDLVLVGLTLGNDLSHAYYAARRLAFEEQTVADARLPPDAFTDHPGRRLAIRIDRTLQSWRWYEQFVHSLRPDGMTVWLSDRPFNVQVFGLNHSLGHFYARSRLPAVEASYRDLQLALAGLANVSSGNGAWTVAMALFPQRFQVHQADWRTLSFRLALEDMAFDLDQPNRRIAAACAQVGLSCVDLLQPFRENQADSLYLPQGDMHWNAAGHRLAGQALGAHLADLMRE